MSNSAQLHRLATNPRDYMRWKVTGQLPKGDVPDSPLIDLLNSLSPKDRIALRGVTVNASLGYNGSRTFGSAEQALRWVAPSREVFGSFPAKSWQRRNTSKLTLNDLLDNTMSAPHDIRERYKVLCRSESTPEAENPSIF